VIAAMIDGVVIKPLKLIADERGYLMEILRSDDECFLGFGQVYVSSAFAGVVKAWHAHRGQTDNMCCVAGNVRMGLYDDREDSPTRGETQSIVMGGLKPLLIQIPPLVWHGYVALGGQPATVLNTPTALYNYTEPDELRRAPFDPEIPFEWVVRGG
jgi:dTDP-4-dehydrorhamnose 3,5-epimerase